MKKQTIITIVVMAIIFVAVVVLAVLRGHNNSIPENTAETVGNTSGNLNNMGYFCEHEGRIYFANFADNYYLYSMDPVTLDAERIVDVPVSYINAAGEYLYFYYNDQGGEKFMGVSGNMRGVYRIKANGKDSLTCLDRTTSGIVSLLGNKLYYQHYNNEDGMTLYSVTTDGREKEQVSEEIINPSCIMYGNIYYPDMTGLFNLKVFSPDTNTTEEYLDERMYNPICSGDYIFFMNVADDYCLYRYGMYDQSIAKLTKERLDLFNVYGDYVFYQTNSDSRPRLVRMRTDGSNPEIIAEGNYTDINCTSTYTFFRPFDDENTFYMISTQGPISVANFMPIFTVED